MAPRPSSHAAPATRRVRDQFSTLPTDTGVMFTEIASAPVSVTMNWTLQMSDNLYAESYSRTLGLLYAAGSQDATLDGIAAVEAQLALLGIDTTAVIQQDGSGVARSNLVTPGVLMKVYRNFLFIYFLSNTSTVALTQVLIAMDAQPEAELYRSFLPLAGETGTLVCRHQFDLHLLIFKIFSPLANSLHRHSGARHRAGEDRHAHVG